MEFSIGDKVQITYNGEIGVVTEKYKNEKGTAIYLVSDGCGETWFTAANELVSLKKNVAYTYEIEYLGNVVVARFYEVKDDIKTELAIGHGHIMHEGALGVAQAASYALKRIYTKFEEDTYGARI